MGSIFSKALVYLGLVDEDPADPDQRLAQDEPQSGRRPESRRPLDSRGPSREHEHDEWGEPESQRDEGRRGEPRLKKRDGSSPSAAWKAAGSNRRRRRLAQLHFARVATTPHR